VLFFVKRCHLLGNLGITFFCSLLKGWQKGRVWIDVGVELVGYVLLPELVVVAP